MDKRTVAVIALVVLIAAVFAMRRSGGRVGGGKAAPEISLTGVANAEEVPTLANLRGKPVLLEFWATWCPPCRESIPHLIEIHEKHKDRGLVVIGITNEAPSAVEPFIEKMGMTYIVGYDGGGRTGNAYRVTGIPHAFLIAADGTIAWNGHPMALEDGIIAQIVD
ncbi:MAG: TlpA disulfide reductase family protein [Planctomycetota bacterium]